MEAYTFGRCSGFACNDQVRSGQSCMSMVTSGHSVAAASCSSGSTILFNYITVPSTVSFSGLAGRPTFSSYSMFAPMIELRRQASDTQPLSTSAAAASTSVHTTSSTSIPTPHPATSSSGLSIGAKVAMSVCIPIVAAALLLAAILLWRRRVRNSSVLDQHMLSSDHCCNELSGESARNTVTPEPKEMCSVRAPGELEGNVMVGPEPQELPGEHRA